MRPLPFLLALSVVAAAEADDAPPAVHSAAELKAQLLAAAARLESLYVEYRCDSYPESAGFPKGAYLYRIVAARAPYYLYHVSAHGDAGLAWEDDPLQQRSYVTATRAITFNPVNRTFFEETLTETDPLPGSLPEEFYFTATGVWPLPSRPTPRDPPDDSRPVALVDVARTAAYNYVRPSQERVRGVWCHVLEHPGRDVLWLDPARGCALLARETFDPTSGEMHRRLSLIGHQEAAPGVWLPTRIENHIPAVGLHAEFRMITTRANDLTEDFFQFTPPPGALRLSADGNHVQAVPGGLDHLESLVAWMDRCAPKHSARPSRDFPGMIVLCVAALIAGVIGVRTIRRSLTSTER